MKRLNFLLILLFIVIGGVFYVFQEKDNVPTENQVVPNLPSEQQNDAAELTGSQGTGVIISGALDDTELPLDQQGAGVDELTNTGNQESDPEVDEIINILEELIAESEEGN